MRRTAELVPLTAAQRLLVERAQERVSAIVTNAARRFPNPPRDDMQQAAMLSCAEASTRFRPEEGIPFHQFYSAGVYGAAIDCAVRILYGTRRSKQLTALRGAYGSMPAEEERDHDLMGGGPAPNPRGEMLERARQLAGALLVSTATIDAATGDSTSEERRRDDLRRRLLREAIATLPDQERRVAQRVWIQGERPEDVAVDEKVTARSIRRYEQRAWPKVVGYINRRNVEAVDQSEK
ncbi:MAG: sigma-70 family RNA polymerase sigma factor [Polyangiaceae bacterium]